MIKIAVQTGGPEEEIGIDSTYRMIKEAGFDAVDANLDHLLGYGTILGKKYKDKYDVYLPGLSEKDILEYFRPWGEASKKYDLKNYQAHAPFPSLLTGEDDPEYNDFLITMLEKTIMGCASIDCQNLIIHPFCKDYDHQMSHEEEWEINIDRYSRLIPAAKKYGVVINLENMFFDHNGKIYGTVCNDGVMAAKYVDTLNQLAGEKCFGFCLDTGHALLASKDIRQFMNDLGDRLTCFHVHDNDGVYDLHRQPYTGKMDWDRFILGLKDIHFDKTMSFETFNAWRSVPRELGPAMLQYIAKIGRMFAEKASE